MTPLKDEGFGGRSYSARGPEGHAWTFGIFTLGPRAQNRRRHHTRARRTTFPSIESQIIAAMSGPPKSRTWRMPVGDVTLISVR